MLTAQACSPTPEAFSKYDTLDNAEWPYEDTLVFIPTIAPYAEGELSVGIRHNGSYPYRNLWLEITTPVGSDSITMRDTVAIELADRYGLWRGTGLGALRQLRVPVRQNVRVDSGSHILVRHIMRADTLRDIEQVGIFIEKTK